MMHNVQMDLSDELATAETSNVQQHLDTTIESIFTVTALSMQV